MSALDFAARGLAAAARSGQPRMFAALAGSAITQDVARIETAGHAEPGIGMATYVCDAQATAALAAAHPLACIVAADGRVFRLAGGHDGFVTPEMLGCPQSAAGVNQQPYVQAAIDYCAATRLVGVRFTQARYELWCPAREGYAAGNGYDDTNHSGNFMVIPAGGAIALRGMHSPRTIIDCRGPTGGNLLSDFQVVPVADYGGDCIWRGAAIKLCGTAAPSDTRLPDSQLTHIDVRDLIVRTGMAAARNTDWPARAPSHPNFHAGYLNCWDISNKCIYTQQTKQMGHFHFENCEFTGWFGEVMYLTGVQGTPDKTVGNRVVIRNCRITDSNGQALNPHGPLEFDVEGLWVENCAATWEGLAGPSGRLVDCHFRNCSTAGLYGGSEWNGALRPDGSMPVFTVDATFEDCGTLNVGSYVHGRLRLIDTSLNLEASNLFGSVMPCRGNRLDVTSIAHAKGANWGTRFGGLDVAGTRLVSDNHVRLDCQRTAEAAANSKWITGLCVQYGSLGDDNYLHARGYANQIGGLAAVTDRYAAIIDEGVTIDGAGFGASFDPTTTSAPIMGSGFMRATGFAGPATCCPVELPSTAYFNDRAEITIYNYENNAGKLMALHYIGNEVALVGFKQRVRLRNNRIGNRWDLIESVAPQKAIASIDIAATALGAETGPYTVPSSGCRPWHRVDAGAGPGSALPAGFAVARVRPRTDAIDVWLRNVDGANPADPAPADITVRWWVDPA